MRGSRHRDNTLINPGLHEAIMPDSAAPQQLSDSEQKSAKLQILLVVIFVILVLMGIFIAVSDLGYFHAVGLVTQEAGEKGAQDVRDSAASASAPASAPTSSPAAQTPASEPTLERLELDSSLTHLCCTFKDENGDDKRCAVPNGADADCSACDAYCTVIIR